VVHERLDAFRRGKGGRELTVEVISAEQTSQTYLTPPSPPLVAVFLRMTPIDSISSASPPGSMGVAMVGECCPDNTERSSSPSAVVTSS
jgi:hypothetical protein